MCLQIVAEFGRDRAGEIQNPRNWQFTKYRFFFASHGPQYIVIKLKFGTEAYMYNTHARLGWGVPGDADVL